MQPVLLLPAILLMLFSVLTLPFTAADAGTPQGAKALFYTGHGTNEMVSQGSAGAAAESPIARPSGPGISTPTVQASASSRPQQSGYLGVQYWIEVTKANGARERVTADRTFVSGDRIKLFITTNRDGYLYLMNIGSSGRSRVLFPYAGMGPDQNYVQANTEYEVPQGTMIRFDNNPGEELLLLMLSPNPMRDLVPGGGQAPATAAAPGPPTGYSQAQLPPPPPAADPAAGMMAGGLPPMPPAGPVGSLPPLPQSGSGSMVASASSAVPPPAVPYQNMGGSDKGFKGTLTPQQTARFQQVASTRGAKDLFVETDATSATPASYAVAPVSSLGDSGMITLQIKLKHR